MDIYAVCLHVKISKNYREEYSPCLLKLERVNTILMWRIWVMSWTHTENKEHSMAGLKACYSGLGHAWLRELSCFNFRKIEGGTYIRYREGDFLFWYRRMGFWQYISSYDSIKDALAEHPEAVLSYRNIKIGTKEREISAPYKESDLKSKPAFYNREAFWVCLGSFLIAASLLTGLLLIRFISFLSIFMLVPAIFGTLVIMKGENDYVWR